MPRIVEDIPDPLQAESEAARAWFSEREGAAFKLTGVVDPPDAPPARTGQPLQLILCGTRDGQEVCLRESFAVRAAGAGFAVSLLDDPPPALGSVAPTLDPPPGERRDWLDATIARHAFTVVLFYRGFW